MSKEVEYLLRLFEKVFNYSEYEEFGYTPPRLSIDNMKSLYNCINDLHKENERLKSIIKEARKKIESVQMLGLRSGKTLIATLLNDILEIIDEGE